MNSLLLAGKPAEILFTVTARRKTGKEYGCAASGASCG
jgi:hypothetical protein